MAESLSPDRQDDEGTLRLLVADDDDVVRASLSAQLGRRYQVVGVARDADEAIAVALETRPDLALLDVQMPAGGGLRATQEIRQALPDTTIVALSSDESEHLVLDMLQAGAVTYLRKGASSAELLDSLRKSIEADAKLKAAG